MRAPKQTATHQSRIDRRSPRFGAGVTGVLLLTVIGLALGGATPTALILFSVITVLFAWGAFASVLRHPYGLLFKKFVRPRLKAPNKLEDPILPTFAQGVSFVIALIGVVLALLGLPIALPIAAAVSFVAAFLNSAFG